jgi:hypothetical protein
VTRTKWAFAGLGLLTGSVVLAFCLRGGPSGRSGPAPGGETLEIGPDTTRLTGPLTPDGRVDYAAALNAGGAPDPEENAAIPLLRVLGTNALIGNREEVLRLLRAPEDLPADGIFLPAPEELPLFLDFEEMDVEQQAVLLDWLRANQAALDAVVEGTRRPRLWWPVVNEPRTGALALALPIEASRPLGEALGHRAGVALAQGRTQAGWTDVAALVRLRALEDQLPGSVIRLLASAPLVTALDWLERALEASALEEHLGREALEALRDLPPAASLADDLDGFDRFFVLGSLVAGTEAEVRQSTERVALQRAYAVLNVALRTVNRAHDDVVPWVRAGTREGEAEVERRVEERQGRVKQLSRELGTMLGVAKGILEHAVEGDEWIGSRIGEVAAASALVVVPIVLRRQRICEAQRRRVLIAVALRLHAFRHGEFPTALEALVPETLPALPTNPLDDQPYTYARTDSGCVLDTEDSAIELTR